MSLVPNPTKISQLTFFPPLPVPYPSLSGLALSILDMSLASPGAQSQPSPFQHVLPLPDSISQRVFPGLMKTYVFRQVWESLLPTPSWGYTVMLAQ